jgi:hypothetical protein
MLLAIWLDDPLIAMGRDERGTVPDVTSSLPEPISKEPA